MAKEIPVNTPDGQQFMMLVDDEDYELMSRFNWRAQKDSAGGWRPFATIRPHRLLVNYELVDHINGEPMDNRKNNLRSASKQQNSANRGLQSNNTTGFKGIYFQKTTGKYRAHIQVNGKRISLGSHKTSIDAAKAYDTAASEHFGEFARLNFPEREVV